MVGAGWPRHERRGLEQGADCPDRQVAQLQAPVHGLSCWRVCIHSRCLHAAQPDKAVSGVGLSVACNGRLPVQTARWPPYRHWSHGWGSKSGDIHQWKRIDLGHGTQQGTDCSGCQVARLAVFCCFAECRGFPFRWGQEGCRRQYSRTATEGCNYSQILKGSHAGNHVMASPYCIFKRVQLPITTC